MLPPSQPQEHYNTIFGRTRYLWMFDLLKLNSFIPTISWSGFVQHMMKLKAIYDPKNRIRTLIAPHLMPVASISLIGKFPIYVDKQLLFTNQYQLMQKSINFYDQNYGFDLSQYIGGNNRIGVPKIISFTGAAPTWSQTILLNPDDTAAIGTLLRDSLVAIPQVKPTVDRAIKVLLKKHQQRQKQQNQQKQQKQQKQQQKQGTIKTMQIRLDDLEYYTRLIYNTSHVLKIMKQHHFVPTDVIYLAVLTSNTTYVQELKNVYPYLFTLKDLGDTFGGDCNANINGLMCVALEQHLCARGEVFIGSSTSFGFRIESLRSFRFGEKEKNRNTFWFDQTKMLFEKWRSQWSAYNLRSKPHVGAIDI